MSRGGWARWVVALGIAGAAAGADGEARAAERPFRLTIADFSQTGGDPRFQGLGRSLPEAIALSLIGNERVEYIERAELWRAAMEEFPMNDLQRDPLLVLDPRVLRRIKVDLVLRGEYLEYRGKIRVEAKLDNRRSGKVTEIAPEVLDSRDIYQPVTRIAKEIAVALGELASVKGGKRLAVLCFTSVGGRGAKAARPIDENIALSFSMALEGLSEFELVPRDEARKGCREKGGGLKKVAESLNADVVLTGLVQSGGPRALLIPELYIREPDLRVDLGSSPTTAGDYEETVSQVAREIKEILKAVLSGGQWNVDPLRIPAASVEGYIHRARYFLQEPEKPALGALMAQRAIALDERKAEAHYLLGLARRKQGRTEEALNEVTEAVRLDPNLREGLVELGRLYRESDDFISAEKAYRRALDISKSADLHVELAELYFLMRKPGAAHQEVDGALALDPRNAPAHLLKGRVLESEGRLAEAVAALKAAVELKPDLANARATLRNVYFKRGRQLVQEVQWDAALSDFLEAKTLRPDAAIYTWIAHCFNEKTEYDKTVDLAEEAERGGFQSANLYGFLGTALRSLRRYDEALRAYEQSLRLDAKNTGSQLGKADVLFRMTASQGGKPALDYVDQLIAGDPASNVFLRSKAGFMLRAEKYADALVLYDEVIRRDPKDVWGYQGKALALEAAGQIREALAIYEVLIQREPEEPMGYNGKAYLLGELGHYDEAIDVADRLLKRNERYPNIYNHKGFSQFLLGKKEEGLANIRKALALSPQYGGAYLSLARIAALEGRDGESLRNLRKAVDLSETARRAARGRKEFERLADLPEFREILGK